MYGALIAIGTRYRTGQTNPVSGGFEFDGYVDGSWSPYPTAAELKIPLAVGNGFPPIASAGKSCYWKLVYRL
jgi:hypothetical protein